MPTPVSVASTRRRTYEEFVLQLDDARPDPVVRVLAAPSGTGASEPLHVPPSASAFVQAMAALGLVGAGPPRVGVTAMSEVQQVGELLFSGLVHGKIARAFYVSQGIVRERGHSLRIRLRIDPNSALARCPWEMLWTNDGPLAAGASLTLVRELPVTSWVAPRHFATPIRVLVAAASPPSVAPLNLAQEIALLRAALEPLTARNTLELTIVEDATWSDTRAAIATVSPDVFHFIGHGVMAAGVIQEPSLLFEDRGNAEYVPAGLVAQALGNGPSSRLVYLNACYSGAASAPDPAVTIAGAVLRAGVPAVIAMGFPITDETASTVAAAVYEALAHGAAVDEALGQARQSVAAAGNAQWSVPVLYAVGAGCDVLGVVRPGALGVAAPPLFINRRVPAPWEPSLCELPEGVTTFTNDAAENVIAQDWAYHVKRFLIGVDPVTNLLYEQFIRATGYRPPAHWEGARAPIAFLYHPVTHVTWLDALEYCAWLSRETGVRYRLPTEAEWQYAASGGQDARWPWGNVWRPANCNSGESGLNQTTAVSDFHGVSHAFGLCNMAGNVVEWCSSQFVPLPYVNDAREELTTTTAPRVGRGGSFLSPASECECRARRGLRPTTAAGYIGFRVAADVPLL